MLRIAILLFASSSPLFAAGDAGPAFQEGWLRSGPPTATVLAGYGRLHNPDARALVVTGARSPDFARVALHEMRMEQGVMKMRELPRVEVAPHGDFALEPGATHLMLFEPSHALKPGERVEIAFELEDGPAIEAELEVR
jgi:copper(I)-binding protein